MNQVHKIRQLYFLGTIYSMIIIEYACDKECQNTSCEHIEAGKTTGGFYQHMHLIPN